MNDKQPTPTRLRGYRTVEAASAELGLAEITIYRAIAAGRIPAVKINRNWRIPGSYFDDLERQAYSHFEQQSPAWEDARPVRGRPRNQRVVGWTDIAVSPGSIVRPGSTAAAVSNQARRPGMEGRGGPTTAH